MGATEVNPQVMAGVGRRQRQIDAKTLGCDGGEVCHRRRHQDASLGLQASDALRWRALRLDLSVEELDVHKPLARSLGTLAVKHNPTLGVGKFIQQQSDGGRLPGRRDPVLRGKLADEVPELVVAQGARRGTRATSSHMIAIRIEETTRTVRVQRATRLHWYVGARNIDRPTAKEDLGQTKMEASKVDEGPSRQPVMRKKQSSGENTRCLRPGSDDKGADAVGGVHVSANGRDVPQLSPSGVSDQLHDLTIDALL
jgi:hypothetical protein